LQHDLDKLGIAKNSREEKIRARDEKLKQDAENARMAKLYREVVLKEKPVEAGFVPLSGIAGIKPAPKPVEAPEEVGSFGD
jgi:7,8-dihydro-6-hydroxymethylpterin dimethyltransferase